MTSFFTQEELASDEYRVLSGAGGMRDLLIIAASIMGDLCDQVLESPETIQNRFSSYSDFCDWARDFQYSDPPNDLWISYWNFAAIIFDLYDRLPGLSDWDLHEEIFLFDRESPEMPDEAEEYMARDRIIETCFALRRWIRGRMPETETNPVNS